MILVTIDLLPFGDESQRRTLRELFIANSGRIPHTAWTRYRVWEESPYDTDGTIRRADWLSIHEREDGVERLVERVLRDGRVAGWGDARTSRAAQVHGADSERDGR